MNIALIAFAVLLLKFYLDLAPQKNPFSANGGAIDVVECEPAASWWRACFILRLSSGGW